MLGCCSCATWTSASTWARRSTATKRCSHYLAELFPRVRDAVLGLRAKCPHSGRLGVLASAMLLRCARADGDSSRLAGWLRTCTANVFRGERQEEGVYEDDGDSAQLGLVSRPRDVRSVHQSPSRLCHLRTRWSRSGTASRSFRDGRNTSGTSTARPAGTFTANLRPAAGHGDATSGIVGGRRHRQRGRAHPVRSLPVDTSRAVNGEHRQPGRRRR